MTVNNFTYINKTNNHLSHQINDHKNTMSYKDSDADPGLGQERTCGGVKPNPPLLIIRISNIKTIINYIDSLPHKKTAHYHKYVYSKGIHTISHCTV